jgi:dolichol-phosphate mannosyltransferase
MLFSLVVPTYNERHNMAPLVTRVNVALRQITEDYEVIIVDDDSPDRTWEEADELSRGDSHLKVIRRKGEKGLATAVIAGWQAATGEILGVIDADLQHPPEILSNLLRSVLEDQSDIMIASRHVKGGTTGEWSSFRKVISWGATLFAALMLPGVLRGIRDPMSGCFVLKRKILDHAVLNPRGFKILLEVLTKAEYQKVSELPYVFDKRKEGKSKLGPRQYIDFVIHILRLGRETGQIGQFFRYCAVGFSGLLVNEGALSFFTEVQGLYYLYSSVLAVETAIVSNFLLNDVWTFRRSFDRQERFVDQLKRFLRFNVICGLGAAINVSLLWLLTEQIGLHYLISNLVGIAASTLWNYGLSTNFAWSRFPDRQVSYRHPRPQ